MYIPSRKMLRARPSLFRWELPRVTWLWQRTLWRWLAGTRNKRV